MSVSRHYRRYLVRNRYTDTTVTVYAHSPRDAAEFLGWPIHHCLFASQKLYPQENRIINQEVQYEMPNLHFTDAAHS